MWTMWTNTPTYQFTWHSSSSSSSLFSNFMQFYAILRTTVFHFIHRSIVRSSKSTETLKTDFQAWEHHRGGLWLYAAHRRKDGWVHPPLAMNPSHPSLPVRRFSGIYTSNLLIRSTASGSLQAANTYRMSIPPKNCWSPTSERSLFSMLGNR